MRDTEVERELGQLVERVDGLREDVREVKNDVKALHDDVTEIKLQKAQNRGWITGALAVAAIALQALGWILPLFMLIGCAGGPNGAVAWWHPRLKPVQVFVDESMRPECIAATKDALDFWADKGVDYLRYRRALPNWDGFYGSRGPAGTISIRENTLASLALGTTKDVGPARRIRWARVRLARDLRDSCGVDVVAHEIGHALGLEHSPQGLMFWNTDADMSLTQDEIDWVTQ